MHLFNEKTCFSQLENFKAYELGQPKIGQSGGLAMPRSITNFDVRFSHDVDDASTNNWQPCLFFFFFVRERGHGAYTWGMFCKDPAI